MRAGLVPAIAAAVVVAAVGAASPWTAAVARPEQRAVSDFQILHAAGRGLVEGLDVHDPAVLDEVGRRDGRPHTPFCAANPLVVRTVGLLADRDLDAAYRVALGVNAACALAAVVLLAGGLRRSRGDRADASRRTPADVASPEGGSRASGGVAVPAGVAVAIALVALGAGEGLWMSLAMNSTNLVALAAVLAAWRAAGAGRPVLEGALLALAAVAKTSPALLLVVALFAGRRRTFVAGVATAAGLVAASVAWSGWAVHRSWVREVLPVLGYAPELGAGRFDNSLHAWNLAPNGVLSRAVYDADLPRVAALAGAWLVTVLVVVQVVGVLRARRAAHAPAGSPAPAPAGSPAPAPASTPVPVDARAERDARHQEYALGVVAMLLVSSVTWPHHLVFLALPAGWLLARFAGGERGPAVVLGLVALVPLWLPLGTLDADPRLAVGIPLRTAAVVVLFAAVSVAPRSAGSGDR